MNAEIKLLLMLHVLSPIRLMKSEIVEQPSSQDVLIGGRATFKCRIKNVLTKQAKVQWTKNGLGLGYELDLWDRYFYSGEISNGFYDITINNVQLSDEGLYECQAIIHKATEKNPEYIRSEPARLQVFVPPKGPKIPLLKSNGDYKVVSGKVTKIPCNAYNSKPPAIINWYKDDILVEEHRTISNTSLPRNFLYNTTKYLIINGNPNNDYKQYTCKIEPYKQTDLHQQKLTITTRIIHVPQANIELLSHKNNKIIVEGEAVKIQCRAYPSLPPVFNYEWMKDGKILMNEKSETLYLPSIDRHLNMKTISCRAENEAGFSEKKELMLTVKYAPVLTSISDDTSIEIGQSVRLFCDWDGNPKPNKVTWTHEGKIMSFDNQINIFDIKQNQSGQYICSASSKIGSNQKSVKVSVNGPPKISSKDSKNAVVGENVEIECKINTFPSIKRIEWKWVTETKDGEKSFKLVNNDHVKEKSGMKKYESLLSKNNFVGILTIFNVDDKDIYKVKSGYQCFVANNYGKDSKYFSLIKGVNSNKTSNSKNIIIICGITSGIVFILLLIAALYCYFTYFRQRKCTNLKSEANNQLQYSCNNDQDKNNDENLKVSLMGENNTTNLENQTKNFYDKTNLKTIENDNYLIKESHSDVNYSKQEKNEESSSINEKIPTPISNHDDGYHTEGGSWHQNGTLTKQKFPTNTTKIASITNNYPTSVLQPCHNEVMITPQIPCFQRDNQHRSLGSQSSSPVPMYYPQNYIPLTSQRFSHQTNFVDTRVYPQQNLNHYNTSHDIDLSQVSNTTDTSLFSNCDRRPITREDTSKIQQSKPRMVTRV